MGNKQDISVACCLWGSWPDGDRELGIVYVNKLYRMIQRYLTLPHRFFCFTDQWKDGLFEDDIHVRPIDVPITIREIGKWYVYNEDNGLTGRVLSMDLDTVIVGDMNAFVRQDKKFIVRKTFGAGRRKHNVCNKIGGGLVAFDAGRYWFLWQVLKRDPKWVKELTGGDERIGLSRFIPKDHIHFWQDVLPKRLLRLNQYQRMNYPKRTVILAFTGHPRPHEIDHPIVQEYWHNV